MDLNITHLGSRTKVTKQSLFYKGRPKNFLVTQISLLGLKT